MTTVAAPLDSLVPKPSIKSLALDELTLYFAAQGEPAYRAKQVAVWLYQKRVDSFDAMTDLKQEAKKKQLAELMAKGH
jgi:23S rRNA (adenine2503-C2)-methyltransferase